MVAYFLHYHVLLFLSGHYFFSLWKLIELLANQRTAFLTLLIYYFVYTRSSIKKKNHLNFPFHHRHLIYMLKKIRSDVSFLCTTFVFIFIVIRFVVFSMCTIYSTICATKTLFAYYFYLMFCQMF